jgi:phospholipid/cholesterol/gamma-HCH transport system substrate-binding protein
MRDYSNKRAVIVGLFVVIGLIILASGVLMVGNLNDTFKRKLTIVALFEDVNGLQTGNNIWYSGMKVGTIKDISFHNRTYVSVTMRVDVKAMEYIPKDAKVKLGTDGLIGNKILVIFGGSNEVDQIEEGDTLAVEKGVSQEEVLKILQESNKNLLSITTDFKAISHKASSGEGTVGKLLNDNSLYDNANEAIRSVQQMSVKGQQMLNNLNTYTTKMNQEGTLANDLVTDTVVFVSIREFAQRLQQIADTTAVLVEQLKTISSDSTTSLGVLLHDKESGKRIKEMLINLESSSKKLDEDLEAAQYSWPLRKGFKRMEKEKQ